NEIMRLPFLERDVLKPVFLSTTIFLGLSLCYHHSLVGAGKFKKPTATPIELIKAKKDFRVELLYSVPKTTQGSWVSMCVDPKGRLITSDQFGKLYRITPPPLGGNDNATKVEELPVDLGEAHGLVWAHDSLYVVNNEGRKN